MTRDRIRRRDLRPLQGDRVANDRGSPVPGDPHSIGGETAFRLPTGGPPHRNPPGPAPDDPPAKRTRDPPRPRPGRKAGHGRGQVAGAHAFCRSSPSGKAAQAQRRADIGLRAHARLRAGRQSLGHVLSNRRGQSADPAAGRAPPGQTPGGGPRAAPRILARTRGSDHHQRPTVAIPVLRRESRPSGRAGMRSWARRREAPEFSAPLCVTVRLGASGSRCTP